MLWTILLIVLIVLVLMALFGRGAFRAAETVVAACVKAGSPTAAGRSAYAPRVTEQ